MENIYRSNEYSELIDHVAYKVWDMDKTYTLTGTLYVKDGDALTELMTETVDFLQPKQWHTGCYIHI